MPVYIKGSTPLEIGKLFVAESGVMSQIAKVYEYDGSANNLIYNDITYLTGTNRVNATYQFTGNVAESNIAKDETRAWGWRYGTPAAGTLHQELTITVPNNVSGVCHVKIEQQNFSYCYIKKNNTVLTYDTSAEFAVSGGDIIELKCYRLDNWDYSTTAYYTVYVE